MEEKQTRGRPGAGDSAGTRIQVRLTPRSSRDAVLGLEEGVYRIKLTAPPVGGKANQALLRFLSKSLQVPKSAVAIVSGEKSRDKILSVRGMTAEAVRKALVP